MSARWREKLVSWFNWPSKSRTKVQEGLVREQLRLADLWEQAFKGYEEELKSLAERIHGLGDEALASEVEQLQVKQAALARALERLDLAGRETLELSEELAEWQRAEGRLSAKQRQRQEWLAAELAARGIKSPEKHRHPANEEQVVTARPEVRSRAMLPEPATDELEEWEEVFGESAAEEITFWQDLLDQILSQPQPNQQRACEIAKRLKQASAGACRRGH